MHTLTDLQPTAVCNESDLAELMAGRVPLHSGCAFWESALISARVHGVASLVRRALHAAGWPGVPPDIRSRWRQTDCRLAADCIRRDWGLERTLELLASAGVFPLLVKGAGLAHIRYPDPTLRPRADSDLWISEAERDTLDRVLQRAGYSKPLAIDGNLISYQCSYCWTEENGARHYYDVHWRISNHSVIAYGGMFDLEDCRERGVRVQQLGAQARTLGDADALLLACVHRLAHHADEERLIWLYDVHLLIDAMDERQTRWFMQRADEVRLVGVCRDAIARAAEYFGCRNAAIAVWLQAPAPAAESALRMLKQPRRGGRLLSQLHGLPGWRVRLRFMWQNVFPSKGYMLRRYRIDKRWKLPVFYIRRIAMALPKLSR